MMNPPPVDFYPEHRIGLFLIGLVIVALVLEMVRRGRLKERYALYWLAASGVALLVGLFPSLIIRISVLFEFQYLTVVYVFSFLFLLFTVLLFTVSISRLTERNRELAQEVALLDQRLRAMEAAKKPEDNGPEAK